MYKNFTELKFLMTMGIMICIWLKRLVCALECFIRLALMPLGEHDSVRTKGKAGENKCYKQIKQEIGKQKTFNLRLGVASLR